MISRPRSLLYGVCALMDVLMCDILELLQSCAAICYYFACMRSCNNLSRSINAQSECTRTTLVTERLGFGRLGFSSVRMHKRSVRMHKDDSHSVQSPFTLN